MLRISVLVLLIYETAEQYGCAHCTTCIARLFCTQCDDSYYLSNYKCYPCEDQSRCRRCSGSSGCSSCKDGYYLHISQCLLCPKQCICYNEDVCSICQNGSQPINGQCVIESVNSGNIIIVAALFVSLLLISVLIIGTGACISKSKNNSNDIIKEDYHKNTIPDIKEAAKTGTGLFEMTTTEKPSIN